MSPHAGLHRAERMLDRLATLAHGERVRIKALLHGIEQVLMLPSWNPPLWPCRAPGLERTILTGVGPVTPYPLAIFLAGEAIWQLLSSRRTAFRAAASRQNGPPVQQQPQRQLSQLQQYAAVVLTVDRARRRCRHRSLQELTWPGQKLPNLGANDPIFRAASSSMRRLGAPVASPFPPNAVMIRSQGTKARSRL